MNIVFFSRLFYPHIGGVETHVLRLSEELLKKGHVVTVVTEQHDKDLPQKRVYKKITIYRIPVNSEKRKKYEIWKWLWKNRFLIQNADVVHAHDVGFWFFPFRLIYPSKKIYTTFHGYETVFPPKKRAIAMRKTTELLSNGVICIGEYITKWYGTKPDMVMYGGAEKVEGSTRSASSGRELKVQSLEDQKIKVLFVGRIEKDNGVEIYAKTLELLKKKKVSFQFEAVGDGTMRKLFEKYGKVHGFVQNTRTYINSATVVFASSYLAILESLSAGKTVFSVYTNPLKEDYLKLTPFAKCMYIHNSSKDIVDRIIHPPVLKKAQQWIAKNTWKHVANSYEKLWNQ